MNELAAPLEGAEVTSDRFDTMTTDASGTVVVPESAGLVLGQGVTFSCALAGHRPVTDAVVEITAEGSQSVTVVLPVNKKCLFHMHIFS